VDHPSNGGNSSPFPRACPSCQAVAGMPYMTGTDSVMAMRCRRCGHEWPFDLPSTTMLIEPVFSEQPDRRSSPRLEDPAQHDWRGTARVLARRHADLPAVSDDQARDAGFPVECLNCHAVEGWPKRVTKVWQTHQLLVQLYCRACDFQWHITVNLGAGPLHP
jgi:Zn ribbon nucleic-acid-binding protein